MRERQGKESGLEESGGDAVVAVKLHVIERGGDAKPAGHRRGFVTQDVRARGQYHVAVTHWTADENKLSALGWTKRTSSGDPGVQLVFQRNAAA